MLDSKLTSQGLYVESEIKAFLMHLEDAVMSTVRTKMICSKADVGQAFSVTAVKLAVALVYSPLLRGAYMETVNVDLELNRGIL